MPGLSVSDVINVQIVLSPLAAAVRNFGALLIAGTSPVIDTSERLRVYSTISGVASDFGTSAPEYIAANLFFSQSPQPALLYIGRWAKTATSAVLHGAVLSAAQQALSNFTAVTTGAMKVTVDGVLKTISGVNLSGVTNLNGVASAVTAATTGLVVTWNANINRFDVTSATTGATSTISFATPPSSGVDISTLLGLTSAVASVPVNGVVAESALAATQLFANKSNDWYGLMFADAALLDADHIGVAGFVESANPRRVYGLTSQASSVLDPVSTTDIASTIRALGYQHTFVQYSSYSPYAAASLYGRAFTVDFTANSSTITLMFKQEPGVVAETLTASQAATLKAKNCNAFVNYNNGTAIIQPGVMAGGQFFDTIHGTDWLQNDVQTAVYNLLYTNTTKVPQTDAGVNQILATIESRLAQGVANGLIAPGVWNASGFGALKQGQTLTKGYYTYAPPIALQSPAERATRAAPTIQCAIKLGGAVHSANVIINVNQ